MVLGISIALNRRTKNTPNKKDRCGQPNALMISSISLFSANDSDQAQAMAVSERLLFVAWICWFGILYCTIAWTGSLSIDMLILSSTVMLAILKTSSYSPLIQSPSILHLLISIVTRRFFPGWIEREPGPDMVNRPLNSGRAKYRFRFCPFLWTSTRLMLKVSPFHSLGSVEKVVKRIGLDKPLVSVRLMRSGLPVLNMASSAWAWTPTGIIGFSSEARHIPPMRINMARVALIFVLMPNTKGKWKGEMGSDFVISLFLFCAPRPDSFPNP